MLALLALSSCYARHGRDAPIEEDARVPDHDGGFEGVCFDEAELTLTIRPGVGCAVGTVEGRGVVVEPGFPTPMGTPIRLVREGLARDDVHLRANVRRCPDEGPLRLYQVSSLYSDCDGSMTWVPECDAPVEWDRTWRWVAHELRSAELLLAGEGGIIEIELCEVGF